MKHYFISYTVRRIGSNEWHFANALINEDPLQWIVGTQEYSDKEIYVLISYQEINADQYEKYNDLIN